MKELVLQFDGFCEKRRNVTVKKKVPTKEQVKNKVKTYVKSHQEQLEVYVGGPAIMLFLGALYYLASVLEGGAA